LIIVYIWNTVETSLLNVTIYSKLLKILSYTLLTGEEEFVATYEDIVYFVFHTGLERNVAVKVLEKELQDRQAVKFISSLPKVFFEYLATLARHVIKSN